MNPQASLFDLQGRAAFISGAFHVLAQILGVVAFGTTPLFLTQVTWASGEKYAGAAAALTNAVQQCGSALAPIVVGGVFAIGHSFSMEFLTLAMGPLTGLIALIFLTGQGRPAR